MALRVPDPFEPRSPSRPLARLSSVLLPCALLTACGPGGGPDDPDINDEDLGHSSGDSGIDWGDDGADTGEPDEAAAPPIFVLAGGGSEGELGEDDAWSARLYRRLIENGDVSGDGRIEVAVLSTSEESEWLPGYLEWLGADDAFNLKLASAAAADDPALDDRFAGVDAVFIKGGDQGEYYDLWNDRRIEDWIRVVVEERQGGYGGTSAGAMAAATWALAGGRDLISADVLADAHTDYLDDATDGGSGIHSDFLGFVPALIDSHFDERGRLGRLAGACARAIEDESLSTLLGIGIEQRTGLVLQANTDGRLEAEVIGIGAVTFLQPSATSVLVRESGHPLIWTDLQLDRLTEGGRFDLDLAEVAAPPDGAEAVAWDGIATPTSGYWYVDGDLSGHEERFSLVAERPSFSVHAGEDTPVLEDAIGFTDAHDDDARAENQEAMFRALYEQIGITGFLIGRTGSIEQGDGPSELFFYENEHTSGDELATIVLDTSGVSWRALAPEVSNYDVDGTLRAASLVGVRAHVIGESDRFDLGYDVERRQVIAAP